MNSIMNTVMNDLEPTEFYLSQNYPNPFSEKTTIKFCVAYKTKVKLIVFNSDGKIAETLMNEEKEPGTYEVVFQSAVCSRQLANGVYDYQMEAGDFLIRKKMTLLRQE